MPRPKVEMITFTIDGREIQAPKHMMLVDAAKRGDIEIPVFCYEPKLGQPVGACRMCLVEVEGIPKLQTACSTGVKDGMVIHTQNERVHEAQRAVVEFLLINHPLDCPVCDKGGECPLQDVTYGWGPGTSRFIEAKRHFKKPLELSPLIAIDRERCVLCYRCVRFSQEVSEDYQLVLNERGAHSYVTTFDSRPYSAPFSGNIIELCPVGALTSTAYRFRARPWDIEGSGSVCTLCPAQCNVEFTVRDDKIMRVLGRDHAQVDDGWLCDKGRFAYQHVYSDDRIIEPLVREGDKLQPVSWERALTVAANALDKACGKVALVAGGHTTNEEGFLWSRLLRERLSSDRLHAEGGADLPDALRNQLDNPAFGATVEDLEFAHTVLLFDVDPIDAAPVWDLRIRKGIRHNNVQLCVASARPTALDRNAALTARFAPTHGLAFLQAINAELEHAGSSKNDEAKAIAEQLKAQDDVVIVVGEDSYAGPDGSAIATELLMLLEKLNLKHHGAGLLEIPNSANGRGLREVGFDTESKFERADGVDAIVLLNTDPVRSEREARAWRMTLDGAQSVITQATFLTDTVRKYATVVFPAESYAEIDGTVTHPDGRLQRVRPAVGRPRKRPDVPDSGARAGWRIVNDIATRLNFDLDVAAASMASQQMFEQVDRYRGITLDAIAGRGIRWQDDSAERWFEMKLETESTKREPRKPCGIIVGTYRPIWTGSEVVHSPALNFARPLQQIELSKEDAKTYGIKHRGYAKVEGEGFSLIGRAIVRGDVPQGSIFVARAIDSNAVASEFEGTQVKLSTPQPVETSELEGAAI